MTQNGKGDKNRTVNMKQYQKNYDVIFTKKKKKTKNNPRKK